MTKLQIAMLLTAGCGILAYAGWRTTQVQQVEGKLVSDTATQPTTQPTQPQPVREPGVVTGSSKGFETFKRIFDPLGLFS